jgi:cytochrome P450
VAFDDVDLTDLTVFEQGAPHKAYRRLRDEAPLYWHASTAHTPGGEGFWCLIRHEDLVWAARNPDLLSSDTLDGLLDRVASFASAGPVERTRSNKHAGFRHVPLHLVRQVGFE